MNLPNKLTVLRIVMVPFFVFFMLGSFVPHRYLWALLLFCAASYTDHLDGKIARRDNLITNFGKLMDPLADKILVMSALICLVKLDLASTVCVLLIMIREFAITSIRLLAVEQGRVIAANNWGKLKTVSQMVAIIAILLMQYIGNGGVRYHLHQGQPGRDEGISSKKKQAPALPGLFTFYGSTGVAVCLSYSLLVLIYASLSATTSPLFITTKSTVPALSTQKRYTPATGSVSFGKISTSCIFSPGSKGEAEVTTSCVSESARGYTW